VTDTEELEALREVSPQASLFQEGCVTGVLLPSTKLVTPGGTRVMDTVLCPRGLAGYVTRLLLATRIPEKNNLNWQQVMLLGRVWQTWSWNAISPGQPWIRIFAEHARLLR
jgi:hypothetical protein